MVRMLILAVALGSGGLATWLTLAEDGRDVAAVAVVEAAPEMAMEEILVASADLGQGATMLEASMRWQPWPAGAMVPGFISRSSRPDALAALSGSVVRSRFLAGEPIREGKLAAADSGYMSALLPAGKRAVAVRISAESTAGGFVLPDDRVDVVHTVTRPGSDGGLPESVSRTILSNIHVLAVDQTQSVDSGDASKVVVGSTATLELDARQVEIVTAAESSGMISLALRSAADHDELRAETAQRSASVRVHRDGQIELVKVSSGPIPGTADRGRDPAPGVAAAPGR